MDEWITNNAQRLGAYLNVRPGSTADKVLQTDRFKKPMAELGMAPPPAADNTPEKFDKFMRDEIARQGPAGRADGTEARAAEELDAQRAAKRGPPTPPWRL